MRQRRFTTEQQILMLLVKPVPPSPFTEESNTKRDIQRGLKRFFGKEVSTRHIARLISRLEGAGVIKRHRRDQTHGRLGARAQASRYEILDFDGAFD